MFAAKFKNLRRTYITLDTSGSGAGISDHARVVDFIHLVMLYLSPSLYKLNFSRITRTCETLEPFNEQSGHVMKAERENTEHIR